MFGRLAPANKGQLAARQARRIAAVSLVNACPASKDGRSCGQKSMVGSG
jgi:hypothetical protein